MDDDLKAVTSSSQVEPAGQGRFGYSAHRVGSPLGRRDVVRCRLAREAQQAFDLGHDTVRVPHLDCSLGKVRVGSLVVAE